jgi:hypothetical protein
LAGATVGAFARAARVLVKPNFTDIAVHGHRAFCQVLALVGLHDCAPAPHDRD